MLAKITVICFGLIFVLNKALICAYAYLIVFRLYFIASEIGKIHSQMVIVNMLRNFIILTLGLTKGINQVHNNKEGNKCLKQNRNVAVALMQSRVA